jgi:hypothetical protein
MHTPAGPISGTQGVIRDGRLCKVLVRNKGRVTLQDAPSFLYIARGSVHHDFRPAMPSVRRGFGLRSALSTVLPPCMALVLSFNTSSIKGEGAVTKMMLIAVSKRPKYLLEN